MSHKQLLYQLVLKDSYTWAFMFKSVKAPFPDSFDINFESHDPWKRISSIADPTEN